MPPAWFSQLPTPPDRPPVRLADLAWPEIAALPPAEAVALLPVGASSLSMVVISMGMAA